MNLRTIATLAVLHKRANPTRADLTEGECHRLNDMLTLLDASGPEAAVIETALARTIIAARSTTHSPEGQQHE